LADFVAEVGDSNVRCLSGLFETALIFPFGSTYRVPIPPRRSRKTRIDYWRRSGRQLRQAAKVLRDGGERELILRTAWASQSKAT
jgi:hypothetical protein